MNPSMRATAAADVPVLLPTTARPVDGWRRYATSLCLLDAIAVLFAFLVAHAVRSGTVAGFAVPVVGALVWVVTMALGGTYQRRFHGWGTEEHRRVVKSALGLLAVTTVAAILLRARAVGTIALVFPLALVLTLCGRSVARQGLHRLRRRGLCVKDALIVGSVRSARQLALALEAFPGDFRVVAACVPGQRRSIDLATGEVPVLGTPGRVLEAIIQSRASVVMIADERALPGGSLRRLACELEGTGVELLVTPAMSGAAGGTVALRPLAGPALLLVEEPERHGWARLAKSAVDRALAATALAFLLPVLLVIAATIKASSRGPALFRQVRVGLGGRHFTMWKFRTMVPDAEARLAEVLPMNEVDGLLFKMRRDPRVTAVGRFLRRWSLDELPQLWNVLRGDMSIVGPRPPLPREVECYDEHVCRRLLVKPGITGLWQVSGRTGLAWEDTVRLDLHYVENWSLSMDAMIIAKTVSAVARGDGAC